MYLKDNIDKDRSVLNTLNHIMASPNISKFSLTNLSIANLNTTNTTYLVLFLYALRLYQSTFK